MLTLSNMLQSQNNIHHIPADPLVRGCKQSSLSGAVGRQGYGNYIILSFMETYWTATVGGFDDFGLPIKNLIIDGKTKDGPWAIMTPKSHEKEGYGFGIGRGQLYEKQKDGKWLLIKGGG